MKGTDSAFRIVEVLPDLLATYGDGGNAVVLQERLRRRGIATERISVRIGTALPSSGDIYLLGGGEDAAQILAAAELRRSRALARVAAQGRVVLAVCAGMQILGSTFAGVDGRAVKGLGLLDLATAPGRTRAVGEVVLEPTGSALSQPLTGFENHLGITTLGASVAPLGRVVRGIGNGIDGIDGVLAEHVVGTYLHGPVLARNPELADLLLSWAVGDELAPLRLEAVARLRHDRLHAVQARRARMLHRGRRAN